MKKSYLGRGMLIAGFSVGLIFTLICTMFGKCDAHEWHVLQYPTGSVEIRNKPGWYMTYFARVTPYPRMISVYATKDSRPESPGDDSVKAWFNDGGTADISWVVRVTTPCPTLEEMQDPEKLAAIVAKQREFHRQFTGNIENAKNAVRSSVRNVIQQTGPIMSSTENQAARKGEFWQVVFDQLKDGMFQMKPVVLKADSGMSKMLQAMKKENDVPVAGDQAKAAPGAAERNAAERAAAGSILEEHAMTQSETKMAAEVVRDPKTGKAVIDTPSPLMQYGMEVLQFSILETDYDAGTLEKFAGKKKLYLQAEQSKAETIQSIQQRFKRVAQGQREIAEAQWKAEEDRAKKRIEAETIQEKEVIIKETKRTEAETLALVAVVKKKEQETLQKIAELKAQIAANDQLAAETTANAREQQIEIAGAISDHDKGLGEILVQEAEAISLALQKIQVPDTVILSPEALNPGEGTAMDQALPSMRLLRAFGLLKGENEFKIPPKSIVPSGDAPKADVAKAEAKN